MKDLFLIKNYLIKNTSVHFLQAINKETYTLKPVNQYLLSISLLALVSSCGGGGSNNASTPQYNSSIQQASSSIQQTSSSSSSIAPENFHPEVTFDFPKKSAIVTSPTLTVHGRASDANGIKSIKINGVNATLHTASNSSSTEKFAASANSINTSVDWQATLSIPFGNTDIHVDVEDNLGNIESDSSNPISLKHFTLSPFFLNDKDHDRLVSFGSYRSDSTTINLDTMKISNLANLSAIIAQEGAYLLSGSALDGTGNTNYSSSFISSNKGVMSVFKIDINSGFTEKLIDYDTKLDLSKYLFANVQSGTFDKTNNIYYILTYAINRLNSHSESNIYKFDIATHTITQLSFKDDGTPPEIYFSDITYANNFLYLVASSTYYDNTLWKIPLGTSRNTIITKVTNFPNVLPMKIAIDSTSTFAYVAGLYNIAKINLLDNSTTLIPLYSSQEDFLISYPQSISVDDKRERLLIGDMQMNDIFTVDTETGKRGLLTNNGIGEGSKLASAQSLVLNADHSIAYVMDGGYPPRIEPAIFKIDLATGNRERLLSLNKLWNLGMNFTSIALDEAKHHLYISTEKSLLFLDTNNKTFTFLTTPETVDGTPVSNIRSMHFDSTAKLVYIMPKDMQTLFKLDTNNYAIAIAKDLTKSDGPDITGIVDMVKGDTDNSLFVLNQSQGKMYKVDLLSGKKDLMLDTCLDIYGRNTMSTNLSSLTHLDFNKNTRTIFIQAYPYIVTFNIEQKTCTSKVLDAFDLKSLNDSYMIAINQHEIKQVNLQTLEEAILSR